MARSSWKFQHINSFFYKNLFLSKFKNIKILKVYSRSTTILNFFSKKTIYIYKGSLFAKINLSKFTKGYKIGEFSITRKPFSFPQKNKKNKR